jgi:hypothetical protein
MPKGRAWVALKEVIVTNGSASIDDSTGLPWPHTWRGVYALVIASFTLWVVLLFAFESIFS